MEKNKKQKLVRLGAAAVTLGIFSSSIVYAWFMQNHKIARMQEVVPLNSIFLSAAHRKQEIAFQLGEVNTNAEATHKDYVFSVSGSSISHYLLEIAHTTNNPFTYTIYPANFLTSQPSGTEGVDYVKFVAPGPNTEGAPDIIPDVTAGNTYYYTINPGSGSSYTESGAVAGSYLNDQSGSSPLLGNNTAIVTYSNTDLHQKNAVPLYWKSSVLTGNENDAFCHNYILRVDWTGATIDTKTKETDIVYLFASITTAP